jgi:hypothetical protein
MNRAIDDYQLEVGGARPDHGVERSEVKWPALEKFLGHLYYDLVQMA